MIVRALLLALAVAACATRPSPEAVLSRALERLDAERVLQSGATIEGEGFVDLAVLQQGRAPGVSEPAPYHEMLSVAPGGAAVAFQYDTAANSDARERLRYVADAAGVRGVLPDQGFGFWETRADMPARLRALSPILLLRDALAQGELTDLGARPGGGRRVGAHIAGEDIVFEFTATGDLAAVSRILDVPLRGEVEWRWAYLPPDQGALPAYPSGYEVRLGTDVLRRVEFTRIAAAADPALHSTGDADLPPTPPATSAPPPLSFRELAPGVLLARHVRPGFHHLVVEQERGLVVVDAPAGWLETTLLPPMEWVEGASAQSISQAFVQALAERFPGKRVTHLVLTHWHSDHAGGVGAFLETGAALVASAPTRRAVEAALRSMHRPVNFIDPGEGVVLGAGATAVRIIPVDNNPHADGMLAAHLPAQRLIYLADLFEAGSPEAFPAPARRDTMLWLVGWLDRQGLGDATILNAHGAPSESWMLERLRNAGAMVD